MQCLSINLNFNHLMDLKEEMGSKKKMSSVDSLGSTDESSSNQKQKITDPHNVDDRVMALVKSLGCIMGREIAIDLGKPTCRIIKWNELNHSWEEDDNAEREDLYSSKFLTMCLFAIKNALQPDGRLTDYSNPFYDNPWGFDFWSLYNNGKDVLDIGKAGSKSKIEKIAWITSTAAASITLKETENVHFDSPFLLYLVPSLNKTKKVRKVCKVLDDLGIGTLFLEVEDSIDLQIQIIRDILPEFIVSTPGRVLKLLSLEGIDISGLSLMVVDGLEEAPSSDTYLDAVKSIRQHISEKTQTVCLCDCINAPSDPAVGQVRK